MHRNGDLFHDNSLIGTWLRFWLHGRQRNPQRQGLGKGGAVPGLTLSDDTIRKALKAAQEAAPSLRTSLGESTA